MIPLRDSIRPRRFPVVNVTIIIVCIVVYLAQHIVGMRVATEQWAFRPEFLIPGRADGIGHLTTAIMLSMFMHGNLPHILANMLFLWVFGDNVEDRMGHGKYLVFYLIAGTIATLAHSVAALLTPAPSAIPVVGASGAIAGVLGAYLVLFKHSRIRTLVFLFFIITVIDLPAPVFLVYWFIIQVLSMGADTGVAYLAHIGGFVAGFLLVRVFADTRPPRPPPPPPMPRVTSLRIE